VFAIDKAAAVVFHPNATNERDRFDAPKIEPMASSYATLAPLGTGRSGQWVPRAQESRPVPDERVDVPLSFAHTGLSGTYSISAPTLRVPDGWLVSLVDTGSPDTATDDTTHSFESGAYIFDLTQQAASASKRASTKAQNAQSGDIPAPTLRRLPAPIMRQKNGGDAPASRFFLRVETDQALPVDLVGLTARLDGTTAVLEWETASETGNDGFYIQTKQGPDASSPNTNRGSWSRIGFVDGTGGPSSPAKYRFEVEDLGVGTHFFRLRQVDLDGQASLSDPIRLERRLDQTYAVSSPYPNPSSRQARIDLTVRRSQQVQITLVDILGRPVASVLDASIAGQQQRLIDLPVSRLASGTYFVRVVGEDFQVTRRLSVVR
jgi:hypothetical protein